VAANRRKENIMQARTPLMATAVMLAVLAVSAPAQAQVHLRVPDDIQPPLYAALEREFLPHTDEWAVVVFYRSPECIPNDFNLLDFLDFSGRPFSCDLHIEGRSTWVSLDDPYPAAQFYRGTGAVPVWFVRWSELQNAVADDVLTIGELAALPSLIIGSASFFLESIRNDIRGQRGGNEALVAAGTLADGRSFFFEMTEKFRDGVHLFPHITVQFR
jgi:hypothetical protein